MNYGSVCSGVEAASLAWDPLGWKALFFAEVEPFPSAVLCERFGATRPLRPLDPADADTEKDRKLRESWAKQIAELPPVGRVPNLGDFTKIQKGDYDGKLDLLVGGFPCQSWSVAGQRRGFDDPRGNLALEFIRLAYRTNARIIVGENVPGLLSCDGGESFAEFLSQLCGWRIPVPDGGWKKCGIATNAPGRYGVAWRILDAQYTRVEQFPRAVPQRRRRLFIVGHIDNWIYPATVLFDGEMFGGNTPPSRTKRQITPPGIESGSDSTKWWDGGEKAGTLTRTSDQQFMPDKGRLQCIVEKPDHNGEDAISFYPQRKAESINPSEECANTLTNGGAPGFQNAVCFQQSTRDEVRLMNGDGAIAGTVCAEPGTKQQNYLCYENHAQDARIKPVDVAQAITARMGTGGGNLPLLQETPDEALAFIKNDAGGDQQGYWKEVFPTMRTQITPAVAKQECFHLSFCDANGTRKDRKNGGLYITQADAGKTVTAGGPNAETVIIDPLETPIALDGDKMGKAERAGGSGLGISEDGVMYTQTTTDIHGVAYNECVPLDLRNARRVAEGNQGVGIGSDGDVMNTVTTAVAPAVGYRATVRRLLPLETERLMGFPDNYTMIPWRGKPAEECPDAPRYKACGNSMAVNCMAWLGMRIQAVEKQIASMEANIPIKET